MQECKFFYTDKGFGGFAVMTTNVEFYIITDIDKGKDEMRVKKVSPLPGNAIACAQHASIKMVGMYLLKSLTSSRYVFSSGCIVCFLTKLNDILSCVTVIHVLIFTLITFVIIKTMIVMTNICLCYLFYQNRVHCTDGTKPGCWAPLYKDSTCVIVTVDDRVYLLNHLDATSFVSHIILWYIGFAFLI